MTELKLLAAALIATAMLAAPAMARESYVTSRHLAGNANATNTPGARYIGGGDGFRGHHFSGGFGGTPRAGYGGRDVVGHAGTDSGPMCLTLWTRTVARTGRYATPDAETTS